MPAAFLRPLCASTLLLFSLVGAASVLACPAGQSEVCVVACFCAPGSKEEIGAISASVGQMAASGLEHWIVQSHSTLAAGERQTIPLNIRAQLEPYYDLQVLDSARYKVGDDGELSAANTMLQNPDVNAVTLVDTIVFRHADDAQNNVALWAHELKHVQQYQQWGTHEFATRYTRDYRTVEAPAYEMQSRLARALRTELTQAKAQR